MEFRRIFGRLNLWALVALAVCCNVFLFGQTQQREYAGMAALLSVTPREMVAEYGRQIDAYRGWQPEEAYEQCDALVKAEDAAGAWNVEAYVRKQYVLPLLTHLAEYPAYLEQVQENARRMQGFAIFMSEGAFSRRNIEMTAEDFAALSGTRPQIGNFLAVSALMQYRIADFLLILLLLAVCWQLLAERKKGLWGIVRLTAGGRLRLALRRAGIFLFAAAVFAVLLYGSTLLADWFWYGGADLSAPVQSMPELAKLPAVLSVGSFLVQYLIVKILGTMLLVLVVWVILSAVANTALAMGIAGVAMAGEYALFAFLPVQSLFNLFKYCNLFSYFYLDRLYTDYLNMNLLGAPVNSRRLLLGLLPVLLLAGFAAVIAVHTCRRPEERRGLLLRLYERARRQTDRLVCRLRGFGFECYKLFVVQKGLLVLLALIWLMGQLFPVWGGRAEVVQGMLELRQEQWEGPADDARVKRLMEEERAAIEAEYAEYEALAEGGEDGMMAEVMLQGLNNRQAAYDTIQSDLAAMEAAGVRPWVMNDRWLESLFGEEKVQRELGLLALLALTLLLAPRYAYEEQTGARRILRGSKRGRAGLVRRKQLAALLAVVAVWGIVYGMHAWSVDRFLGVHGLGAPVQAAQWFRQSDWRLTVGAFLLLVYGLRLVMLWIAAELLLLVSTLAHRVQAASLIGIFLLVLPSALWAIGVAVLRPVSLDYLLSLIEVFQTKAFIGYSGFVWYGILTALGIGCCALTSERWMRT